MSRQPIDIIEATIQKYIQKNRPPEHIRDQIDLGYSYDKNTIEIFTIRAGWNKSEIKIKSSYAKIKYIKTKGLFKLYWMRASEKWQSYDPLPESTHIQKLLDCIDEDSYGCFKG